MSRKILFGILLLYLALALVGIDFGLPNHDHAQPYHPDEWYTFQMLHAMNPSRLDFSPHIFEYPTLPFYLWGAIFGVAHLVGFVTVTGSERFFFEHPENLARMMLLGRLWVVLFGLGTVWLTYLFARRLSLDRSQALFAALLMALFPAFVVESHFMKSNVMLVFFTVATLLAADHWVRRGGARAALVTGALGGLAFSMKYTGALLAPIVILAGFLRWRRGGGTPAGARPVALETALAVAAAGIVFLVGTPYALLTPGEFRASVSTYQGRVLPLSAEAEPSGDTPAKIVLRIVDVLATSATPVVLVLSLVGAGLLWRRRRDPLALLAMAWTALFLLTFFKAAGWLITDSRLMPAFPFLVLMATLPVAALVRRHRPSGVALGVVTLAVAAAWTGILLTRFVGPMPQQLASDWARQNLRDAERIHLASKSVYWNPDLPLREYLHAENRGNYERQTSWVFVEGLKYAEARAQEPDVVFLTVHFPRSPVHLEWLSDPAYEVVAEFPGKIRVFGRRLPVWIDFWDVDIWVLRRKGAPASPD